MNNFEKINSMSIDKMVDYLFLLQNGRICGCSECKNSECNDLMLAEQPYEHLCKNFIKQWLESEVRE